MRARFEEPRVKLCFSLLSGVEPQNRIPSKRYVATTADAAAKAAILAGKIPRSHEDDDVTARRLSTLLWAWTDPEVDWPTFMRCDDEADDVDTQM